MALLGDEQLRRRLGRMARERVEREHTLERHAERYADIYAGAISNHPEATGVCDPLPGEAQT